MHKGKPKTFDRVGIVIFYRSIMTKIVKFTWIMLLAMMFAACEQEKVVSSSSLPSEADDYITTHFPDQNVLQVIRERDDLRISYEVILENSTTLEFNRRGEIISIESFNQLPDSVIPSSILAYVDQNHADSFITEWSLDDNRQEIQLNTGLDLEFNMSGAFLRYDD